MVPLLDRFLLQRSTTDAPQVLRLSAAARPALIYAIGDIHGCLAELQELERQIVADAAGTFGEKWIVPLGDYVDRGPASAQVVDHMLAPPPAGFRRICLAGNHEAAMRGALQNAQLIDRWLAFGGVESMRSYGLADISGRRPREWAQAIAASVPQEHIAFLDGLALCLSVPGFCFVHAGLRPGVPLDRQDPRDMQWIRDEFLYADFDFGVTVVHGHTPESEPFVSGRRIGLDTGCFMTGVLTAARIDADGGVRIIQARSGAPETRWA